MLHGPVWDTPFSSSKKEVSFTPETELGYVTSNCMGRAVRQFEKEVSFRPATEVLCTFFLHLTLQKMATAVC